MRPPTKGYYTLFSGRSMAESLAKLGLGQSERDVDRLIWLVHNGCALPQRLQLRRTVICQWQRKTLGMKGLFRVRKK